MKELTSKEIQTLKELIYKLDAMGANNIILNVFVCQHKKQHEMIRNYFDRVGNLQLHKPKNWSKYIKEFTDILNID